MRSFVREKRVYAGEEYMEVSLFTRTVEQERYCKSARRSKRKNVSRPVQNNLNDRNSKRYAKLLIYANFGKNDYYLTFTLTISIYRRHLLKERNIKTTLCVNSNVYMRRAVKN